MNIESFLLTVIVSLIAGIMLGYFGRSIVDRVGGILGWIYTSPRRLVPYKKPNSPDSIA